MNKQINELKDYPKWISNLTKEQQYEWYLRAKEFVEYLNRSGDDATVLENAIIDYEKRYGILS